MYFDVSLVNNNLIVWCDKEGVMKHINSSNFNICVYIPEYIVSSFQLNVKQMGGNCDGISIDIGWSNRHGIRYDWF